MSMRTHARRTVRTREKEREGIKVVLLFSVTRLPNSIMAHLYFFTMGAVGVANLPPLGPLLKNMTNNTINTANTRKKNTQAHTHEVLIPDPLHDFGGCWDATTTTPPLPPCCCDWVGAGTGTGTGTKERGTPACCCCCCCCGCGPDCAFGT